MFECTGLALGEQTDQLIQFFNVSRHKRSIIDYSGVQIAMTTEAAEVSEQAKQLLAIVETRIKSKHALLSWITDSESRKVENCLGAV